MLGFDYFKLLDLLTIARSRKHIEKYYGTSETGRFPERLKPINIKPDVDIAGEFRSIREINNEIRRLNSAPMRRCGTCCRTNKRPTMRNTALRFAAARASSARWTEKKASSTCCGSTF